MDKQTIDAIRAYLEEDKALAALSSDEVWDTLTDEKKIEVHERIGVWATTHTEDWMRQLLAYYDDNEASKQRIGDVIGSG